MITIDVTVQLEVPFVGNSNHNDSDHSDRGNNVDNVTVIAQGDGYSNSWNWSLTDLPSDATWHQWFCQWLDLLNVRLSPIDHYELSLRLTTDQQIQALNNRYRHLDSPTDVLAFAALDNPCPLPPEALELQPIYLGDIVISIDTAQQQARQQGHSLACELGWLASHGLLHLLGWDHPDDESLTRMLSQQERLLRGVGLLSV